jgi:hypothetical protein
MIPKPGTNSSRTTRPILRQALRRGDQNGHLQHERDREPERPLPAGDQGPRPLPQRAVGVEVPRPGYPITGPHRRRATTMEDAVEASAQRVRDHLQRPLPGGRNLLMETAGNTVREIDPTGRSVSHLAQFGSTAGTGRTLRLATVGRSPTGCGALVSPCGGSSRRQEVAAQRGASPWQ